MHNLITAAYCVFW